MKSLIWCLLSFCFFLSFNANAENMSVPDPGSNYSPSGSLFDSGASADASGRVGVALSIGAIGIPVEALPFKCAPNAAIAARKVSYRLDEAQYIEVASLSIETEVRSL